MLLLVGLHTIAAAMNLSSQPTELIITFLTHNLAQTVITAMAVTVPVDARSLGPLLILGSPVPAGGVVEAIACCS